MYLLHKQQRMIVVIVCITNGGNIDTLPGCNQSVCCLL